MSGGWVLGRALWESALVLYGGSETTITDPTFFFSFLPFFFVLISMAHFGWETRLIVLPPRVSNFKTHGFLLFTLICLCPLLSSVSTAWTHILPILTARIHHVDRMCSCLTSRILYFYSFVSAFASLWFHVYTSTLSTSEDTTCCSVQFDPLPWALKPQIFL